MAASAPEPVYAIVARKLACGCVMGCAVDDGTMPAQRWVGTVIPGAHWYAALDGDPRVLALYLRHYSSVKARRGKRPGSRGWKRIVGPGERLVLLTAACDALFVWRRERFRRDREHGVNCAVFRNEGAQQSSLLIREACELAWDKWPGARLFSFVDPRAIRSTNPGYCFQAAGFSKCGRSKVRDLVILERLPPTATEAA